MAKYFAAKGVASFNSPMSKAVSSAKASRRAKVMAATSVGAIQFATDNAEFSDRYRLIGLDSGVSGFFWVMTWAFLLLVGQIEPIGEK